MKKSASLSIILRSAFKLIRSREAKLFRDREEFELTQSRTTGVLPYNIFFDLRMKIMHVKRKMIRFRLFYVLHSSYFGQEKQNSFKIQKTSS
jgi:hypothetical protein